MKVPCTQCDQWTDLDPSVVSKKQSDEDVKEWMSDTFTRAGGETKVASIEERMEHLHLPSALKEALLVHTQEMSSEAETPSENKENDLLSTITKEARQNWPEVETSHPLCEICAEDLVQQLTNELVDTRRERDTLVLLERELERLALVDGDLEMSQEDIARWKRQQDLILRDMKEMKEEKEKLQEKLVEHDKEQESLRQELKALEKKEMQLNDQEDEFWKVYHELSSATERARLEKAQLNLQLENDKKILSQLENANAYTDAFHIEDDVLGMGTINGLRLGRLSQSARSTHEQVEWSEINAAWGQAALLLNVLERKLEFQCSEYKVVPCGSFSRVEKIDNEKTVYELYGSTDWQIGRLLHSRRFDYAMIGFLTCLNQLYEHSKSLDSALDLPYVINKDRINDNSIKLQFNQTDAWTRAARDVLHLLQSLLLWLLKSR